MFNLRFLIPPILLTGVLFLVAGCSNLDFAGSSMGDGTGQEGPPPEYVDSEGDEVASLRQEKLAGMLVNWQRQRSGLGTVDYFVGEDDILEISVFALEQPNVFSTFPREVKKGGNVELPLVGDVAVAGLNTKQATQAIIDAYDVDFIKDPRVTVKVLEYKSAPVVVSGAVTAPGVYFLTQNSSTVLEMLSQAEGLTQSAGENLLIVRGQSATDTENREEAPTQPAPTPSTETDDDASYDFSTFSESPSESAQAPADSPAETPPTNSPESFETIVVDLKRLLDSGDLSQNVSIVGGDVITIPPRKTEFVYVLGYVKRPGAYVIDKDNDVRALWAVAQAGGLTAAARPQNVVLIREKDGKRISLDLRAIAKGQSPPLYMKPGDTLIVGSNAFMKLIDWVNPAANVGVTASPIP